MPKKISQLNTKITDNYFLEYERIELLFSVNKYFGTYDRFGINRMPPYYSLENILEECFFNSWSIRGTYVSVLDMRKSLGIDTTSMKNNFSNEKFVEFIQYVLNGVCQIADNYKNNSAIYISDPQIFDMIIYNCENVLDTLNYTIEFDETNGELFIIEKDMFSTAVSEAHEEISKKVIEYKRYSLQGDLERKAEILCTLYKKLEAISKILSSDGKDKDKNQFYELYTDATFLYNKSGIRHFVDDDYIASRSFLKMSESELENWYDKIYDMFLTCILVADYVKDKQKISYIKKAIEIEK